ncbi:MULTISPECIES: coiled-coil domain-containing protein [Streptomyces]|uniref:cellulose-binding protein n=1 Tax=Streptomyces TaxID=1883 RepID=UPI0021A9333A|nr:MULTISPECIES: cellulose-binding protein [Streptomyces]
MSSTSMSPYCFVTVRGRGYRPEQVDTFMAALSEDRDAAWERAARLTVLAKDMEKEVERLQAVVAELPPQTYESLGDRAQRVYRLVLEEAAALRDKARRALTDDVAEASERAENTRSTAQEQADALRADTEERTRQLLLAARAEADDIRIGARLEVKEQRGEALGAVREVRQRTTAMLAEQAKEHAERWAEAEREEVASAAAVDAHNAERIARAEAALSEAKCALGEAEESSRRAEEAAQTRAAEILAEARAREDRIARDTERVLREHGETWDGVQAHMDHMRNSLMSLTGRATAE